jgi:outer membrane protein assembly factor BamB
MFSPRLFAVAALFLSSLSSQAAPEVSHSFLATGPDTAIIDPAGQTIWSYPGGSRDAWVLPSGNVLIALSKSKEFPGGAVVEVTREKERVFVFAGTQSEVNTVQPLDNGNILLTEAGDRPRLLEVTRDGKIAVEVPLQAQSANHHLQSRMARKLPNGHYLVPQLLDRVVREYAPDGKIVWEVKTPDVPKDSWPFTAIRVPNGNTLITCTHGAHVIEVDAAGKIVWQLTNADLDGAPLKDPCGAQRLANGNTVIATYGNHGPGIKLIEVTPLKQVVWTYASERKQSIHTVQILDTNGVAEPGLGMK